MAAIATAPVSTRPPTLVKTEVRPDGIAILTIDDEEVTFLTIETTLYVPELLRKRVALSVISYVYRGFS